MCVGDLDWGTREALYMYVSVGSDFRLEHNGVVLVYVVVLGWSTREVCVCVR